MILVVHGGRSSRAVVRRAKQQLLDIGAHIFGDPLNGKFAFLVTGHHLTIRCDADSEEGPAFGGPIYYGHTPNGWSERNLFYYQSKAAKSVLGSPDVRA